jgi:hypothetical protein
MLLQQALIGTVNGYGGLQGLPQDVQAIVPAVEPEQQLLLAAGMLALYQAAGQTAVQRTLPTPAPAEPARYVPAAIQAILDECLQGEWAGWWPAVAARLARHAYVIAPERLVRVLNTAKAQQQAAWRPLLGTRGLWLAQQNAAWSWALADAEKIERGTRWLEGNLAERVQALREQRGEDAASARAWLEAVWKGEKAEVRQALLEPLFVGLGQEDEPFLNMCLADRSQAVRTSAVSLLVMLPASALAQRLRERAMGWVQWQAPAAQGALGKLAARLSGSANGALQIQPAQEWDKSWSRDGLEETPAQGEGARAFWLRQLVSSVPPALWTEHSGQEPETFIKAAFATDWGEAMGAGLSAAALRYRDPVWALALYRAYTSRKDGHKWMDELVPAITAAQCAELCAERLVQGDFNVGQLLAHCPAPWTATLHEAILRAAPQALRHAARAGAEVENFWALTEHAALNLPAKMLTSMLPVWQETIEALELRTEDWRARSAVTGYRRQLDLIERRLQFDKEIPL